MYGPLLSLHFLLTFLLTFWCRNISQPAQEWTSTNSYYMLAPWKASAKFFTFGVAVRSIGCYRSSYKVHLHYVPSSDATHMARPIFLISLLASAEVVQARQLPEGHYTISLRGFRVLPAHLVLNPKGVVAEQACPTNQAVF